MSHDPDGNSNYYSIDPSVAKQIDHNIAMERDKLCSPPKIVL